MSIVEKIIVGLNYFLGALLHGGSSASSTIAFGLHLF